MENTLVLIFSLFREYVCLMEYHNTRLPNARLPNAIVFFFVFFFYEITYFSICFYLFLFNLFLFNDLKLTMLKVVLTSFFFIILAELALDTIMLLRQLVFCTYSLFGTLKIHYDYGRVAIALVFGSDGRGFDSHHRRSYFYVPDFILNYNIHDIFFHLNVS